MRPSSSRSLLLALATCLLACALGTWRWLPQVPGWLLGLQFLAAGVLAGVALSSGAGAGTGCGAAPRALQRRYTREMLVALGAYAALLVVSLLWLRHVQGPLPRALVALLPVPPIALVLRAMVRYVRGVDELQQRIELEAVCIAAAGVSLAYMTGGFLQAAGVVAVPASAAMLWVFPLVCGGYGLAKAVVARRYR
ncbi:hypothetical protein [Luteimonas sp. FCS-9]|uniref:hypothetical protein n=1 Tax=Luteimonas sp. FCS-9 TaxID=1547516 RepID=UPI00063E9763|nr:hypothetical protein [Luteimonas sp. FCS-9]KLI98296.1 hypothetical protein WQ56_15495 [Luteimonas sp. FCS-9]